MTQPELLPSAFAAEGDVNEIPASNDGTAGLASFALGFPVINQTPIAQGGIPPQRMDFNGIFKRITEFLMYVQSGGVFAYDASQTYDAGAFVISGGTYYKCIKANSSTNPHAPGEKTYWDLLIPADIVQEVTASAGQLSVKKKDGSTQKFPIGRVTEVEEVGGIVIVTKEDGSKSTFKVVTSVNDDGGMGGNVTVSSGVVAGNVSNDNAWWVKLGGTIPLIIQGAISSNSHQCTLPISFPKASLWATGDFYSTGFNNDVWSGDINVTKTKNSVSFGGENVQKFFLAIGY